MPTWTEPYTEPVAPRRGVPLVAGLCGGPIRRGGADGPGAPARLRPRRLPGVARRHGPGCAVDRVWVLGLGVS